MYGRKVDDRVLSFGVSGKLWRNSLVMYDRETESLWSHITGEAFDGRLRSRRLTMIASVPTVRWKTAREQFADARVLSVNGMQALDEDRYEGYHRSDRIGVRPAPLKSNALPAKEQVIGVTIGDQAKAYPFAAFIGRSVIQDESGGQRLIVFHDTGSEATGVFEAGLIVFPPRTQGFLVKDTADNVWNLLTGEALSGARKGERLTRLPFFQGYWFAWTDFNRKTEVYK